MESVMVDRKPSTGAPFRSSPPLSEKAINGGYEFLATLVVKGALITALAIVEPTISAPHSYPPPLIQPLSATNSVA